MLKRLKSKMAAFLVAAVFVACSAVRVFVPSPLSAFPSKPVVIVACGWNETPEDTWLSRLIADVKDKGYEVHVFRYDQVPPAWSSDRPVYAIGFSYGGDTLCQRSRQGARIDKLFLLNPVRKGLLWDQGGPLKIGMVGACYLWSSYDWFPAASKLVIDSAGNEYHAVMVRGCTHTSLCLMVDKNVENLF